MRSQIMFTISGTADQKKKIKSVIQANKIAHQANKRFKAKSVTHISKPSYQNTISIMQVSTKRRTTVQDTKLSSVKETKRLTTKPSPSNAKADTENETRTLKS